MFPIGNSDACRKNVFKHSYTLKCRNRLRVGVCVLKPLARRGLRVGPSKAQLITRTFELIWNDFRNAHLFIILFVSIFGEGLFLILAECLWTKILWTNWRFLWFSSEIPSVLPGIPWPALRGPLGNHFWKQRRPQPYWEGGNPGNALEASDAKNYRAWGVPAVLSRGIAGNVLRAFSGRFRNFSGISSGKSQPYWRYGPLAEALRLHLHSAIVLE